MDPEERRSLALTAALLAICLLAYFLLIVPRSLTDLGHLSLPTSYDFQSYFLPRFVYGSSELWHGRFPLWNPFEYGGVPFFATSQPEVLYPPKALIFAFLPPNAAYWTFMVVHYLGLSVGFVLFAREQKISGLPLFVGAAAWTFAMPVLISNYHPTRIALLVPVPFAFLFVERLGRSATLRSFLLLVSVVAVQLLAGYPEVSLDMGLLVALHALVRFLAKDWTLPPWKAIPLFGAAFVLAALLCSVQLLPMLEAGVAANRVGVAEEVIAAPMAVPEAFMTPKIGIVPLFVGFGVLGIFMRRTLAASAGLFACVGITAGGWLLLRRLPGFGMVRFPYVWFIMAPFYAAWLAALGAEAFLGRGNGARHERARTAFIVSLALAWAVFCAVEWKYLSPGNAMHAGRFLDVLAHNVGTRAGAVLGVLAGLAFVVGRVPKVARKVGPTAAAIPFILAVLSHAAGYPFGVRPAPVSRPGRVGEVRQFLDAGFDMQGRALSVNDISYGYELTDGIPSVLGAEESFVPWRYRRILTLWNFVPMFGWFDWGAFAGSRGFLDALNLEYVAAPPAALRTLVEADLRPVLRGRQSVFFANMHPMGHAWVNYSVHKVASPDEAMEAVLDPAFDPRREVVVEDKLAWVYRYQGEEQVGLPDAEIRSSPNEVEYTVTLHHHGIFVVSESFYPGWDATVDKYPAAIVAADYVLRGVELPPGTHHVRFRYRPKSVRYGAIVSLVALVSWIGLVVLEIVRRRRGRTRV